MFVPQLVELVLPGHTPEYACCPNNIIKISQKIKSNCMLLLFFGLKKCKKYSPREIVQKRIAWALKIALR